MPIKFDNSGIINLRAQIKSGMVDALEQGANDVVQLASELAPEDTGALKQSGKTRIVNKHTVQITFGEDLPDARAIAQEYGTHIMPAQPYLTPALRAVDVLHYVRIALGLK